MGKKHLKKLNSFLENFEGRKVFGSFGKKSHWLAVEQFQQLPYQVESKTLWRVSGSPSNVFRGSRSVFPGLCYVLEVFLQRVLEGWVFLEAPCSVFRGISAASFRAVRNAHVENDRKGLRDAHSKVPGRALTNRHNRIQVHLEPVSKVSWVKLLISSRFGSLKRHW